MEHIDSGVASPKFVWRIKSWGVKIFDIRLATVFCLGYHSSKHKMTSYAETLWGT